MQSPHPIRLLQITDCHLFADKRGRFNAVDTNSSFQAVLAHIKANEDPFDLILATGDISHDGLPASYHFFGRETAVFQTPIYWISGNHDQLTPMAETFSHYPHLHSTIHLKLNLWQIVFLEIMVGDEDMGCLDSAHLNLIEQQCASFPHLFTAIVLHYNVLTDKRKGIFAGLKNATILQRLLLRYPKIKFVLYGHIHQATHQTRKHISFLAAPTTGYQSHTRSGKPSPLTPGYRVMHLQPDGKWDTHVIHI